MDDDNPPSGVTMQQIKRHVAAAFQVEERLLTSDRRARRIARPRQVAMWLASDLMSISLPRIGRAFGNRDHTTVMGAIRRVEELRERDPAFAAAVANVRAAIFAEAPGALALRAAHDATRLFEAAALRLAAARPAEALALFAELAERFSARGDAA